MHLKNPAPDQVPTMDSPWPDVVRFAFDFNPLHHYQDLTTLLHQTHRMREDTAPDELAYLELRALLFAWMLENRAEEPTEETERALLTWVLDWTRDRTRQPGK